MYARFDLTVVIGNVRVEEMRWILFDSVTDVWVVVVESLEEFIRNTFFSAVPEVSEEEDDIIPEWLFDKKEDFYVRIPFCPKNEEI